MQIGGSGLHHTSKDHGKLGTKKLNGNTQYRMRVKNHGTNKKTGKVKYSHTVALNLKDHEKSHIDLDHHSSDIAKKHAMNEASTGVVDMFMIYQFIKRLATPFNKWEAFKTGVIDARGNIKIIERKRTSQQKRSFKIFDLLVLRLKKLLEKIPGGRTRLASYAAALMLIKEDWESKTEQEILHESNDTFIDYLRLYKLDTYNRALEEMPTVNMGSGNIAGGGVNGPDDVKVAKKARKHYKQQNKEDAENYHMGIQSYVNQKFNGMF